MSESQSFYLGEGADAAFAVYHPASTAQPRCGVLICPPFGWAETAGHRGLRDWAIAAAQAGHPALRIDPPGSGDAGGTPRDEDRLGAWTRAAGAAGRWLRAESGVARVAAIGIGIGGLVAYRAAALEQGIDDLLLWAVPARGRSAVRELKAFARMNADQPEPRAGEEGSDDDALGAGGFVLSAETVAALGALDLTKLELPGADARRVLLFERDGVPPDAALEEHLRTLGAAVESAPGEGFDTLTSTPQATRTPTAVIETSLAWLEAAPTREVSPAGERPSTSRSIELEVAGTRVRERPLVVQGEVGLLQGVLTEPVDGEADHLRAVLLNAGAVRRTGPGRLWVELARSWAAEGIATLRIDLESIGDSEGSRDYTRDESLYVPHLVDDAIRAIDAVDTERGVQVQPRYLVSGLCSGGYWAFQAALRDARVRSVLMLNPRALYFHQQLAVIRDARKMSHVGRGQYWRRLFSGQISAERLRAVAHLAVRAPVEIPRAARTRRQERRRIEAAFDQLRDAGKRVTFVFGEDEPLDDELVDDGLLDRDDTWPDLEVFRLPGSDHTLRPIVTQRRLHALVATLFERELREAAGQPGSVEEDVRAT